jgi:hypothetical protein
VTNRVLAAVVVFPLLTGCRAEKAADPAVTSPASAPAPAADGTDVIMKLEDVPKSQRASLSQHVANTEITVTYSRPVARGRELFGTLVPYDKPWTPGADRATWVKVTRDVTVNGASLPAGSYSLWAIPRAGAWTMIVHKDWNRFHLPYPGDEGVALRVDDIKAERGQHMETLAWYFPVVEGKDTVLRLHWGETIVPLAIRVP